MSKLTWSTEKRIVRELIPYIANPRQITKDQLDQLKKSLEKFDYVETIAVQPDNTIIAGHMRHRAMLQLGWGDNYIDVRVPSRRLTLDEMREYLIRSNKNTGDWDFDALGNEWEAYQLLDWGFDPSELGILLESEDKETLEAKIDPEVCMNCGQKIRKKKNG